MSRQLFRTNNAAAITSLSERLKHLVNYYFV